MSIKMQSRHTVTPLISLMHYLKENQRLLVKKGEFDHTEYDRNVLSAVQITVFFYIKIRLPTPITITVHFLHQVCK